MANEIMKEQPSSIITEGEIFRDGQSWLTDYQKAFITRTTPESEVFEKLGKDGKKRRYVKSSYVEKVLNLMFDFKWNIEIKSQFTSPCGKKVITIGRLTIKSSDLYEPIIKEQVGSAEYEGDWGDTYKASLADCTKKCAPGIVGLVLLVIKSEISLEVILPVLIFDNWLIIVILNLA